LTGFFVLLLLKYIEDIVTLNDKILQLRKSVQKNILNLSKIKTKLLEWAQQYNEVVFLDGNSAANQNASYSTYDCILAVDAFTSIKTDAHNAFQDLHQYQSATKDWIFGYLTYDLKNDIENLQSHNYDGLQFPELYFFQPKKLFLLKDNCLEMHYLQFCDDEIETDYEQIQGIQITNKEVRNNATIQHRVSKKQYCEKVNQIKEKIHQGIIYETNFCIEFYIENTAIQPKEIFRKLNSISESPFATFFKNRNFYALSASPERYIKKEGVKVISQPIKGTSKRLLDSNADELSKTNLLASIKEQSENVMIVDLVRNDLSKTALRNSVRVEELCKVYSYKQVHQMISTIVSEVDHTTAPVSILQTTFPMGSMTGAPKIAAMEIIETFEETKRGLYSGAVGYFTPDGDFDFNVIIRTVLYNAQKQYVSFSVGSAITSLSDPEKEYEECMLKAKAMFEVLM
jgi:para-aminobenzoate synthetase component I